MISWLGLCLTSSLYSMSVDAIPQRDREDINRLFYQLVMRDQFGYTLFCNKPVSFANYFSAPPDESFPFLCFDYPLQRGWKVWKKYDYLFDSKKFILVENDYLPTLHIRAIVLVNKEAFVNVVNANLPIFRSILGNEATPEQMITDLLSGKDLVKDVLRGNHLLEGIVYGYGVHNPILFRRREEILTYLEGSEMVPLIKPLPNMGFESLEEECEWISQRLEGGAFEGYFLLPVDPVEMVFDADHPETKAILDTYRKERLQLCELINQPNFLELALARFTSSD